MNERPDPEAEGRPAGPFPGEQPVMGERELPALPAWMAPLIIVAVVMVAVLVMANRGTPGTTSDPAAAAARVTTTDDGSFRLTLQAERGTYAAGEPVVAAASLVYLGPKPSISTWGVGGSVLFGVEEVAGDRRIDPTPAAVCAPGAFDRGVAAYSPWAVSGETDPVDPADAWRRAYLRIPGPGESPAPAGGFVLPEGDWRLTAMTSFGEGEDCEGGPYHRLEASVVVSITAPAAGESATP